MKEHPEDEAPQDRELALAIRSLFLGWWLKGLIAGIAILLLGELVAAHSRSPLLVQVSEWVARGGLVIAATSFALGLIDWFERETAKTEESFREQRLSGRYRLIAWSAAGAAVVAFILILWYTTSRGLTSW